MDTGLSLLSQSAREDATVRVLEELVGVGVANPVRCMEAGAPTVCRVAYFGSG